MSQPEDIRPTVGVVGASVRAAVHSLARAGYKAWAVDLFGDRDTKRVAPCVVCPWPEYPACLPQLTARFTRGPIIYTGGLENHPAVVEELADSRELWGHGAEVLGKVRDPFTLSAVLADAGFDVPSLVPGNLPCPPAGRSLRKSFRSAAGIGIRFASADEEPGPDHYFQEFIEGRSLSAVYSSSRLFGISEQLVGEPWLHAGGFTYAGSIGPVMIGEKVLSILKGIGSLLAAAFHLRWLWNLDFVLRDEKVFPVEVNPRYSASVEVIEMGTGISSFQEQCTPSLTDRFPSVGKGIYYARNDLRFPDSGPWEHDLTGEFDPWKLPAFADIPERGAAIPAGTPVCTLLVSGSSSGDCREQLQSRARELDQLLDEGLR